MLFSYRAGAQHQAGSENLKETAAITDSLDREKMLYIAPPFLYDALSEFKGVSLHAQGVAPEPVEPGQPEERIEPGWRQSSFDLAYGLEVEDATDTVPGELLEELFKKPAQ